MGTLTIKVSSGNLESYEALLLQFPDPATSGPVELVELNFGDTSQIFPTAFGLLAAYIGRVRTPGKRPVISRRFGANPLSAKLERAMDGFGFLPAVLDGKAVAKPAPGMVPLIAIGPDSQPDAVANRVLDAVLAVAQPTRDMKETVFVLVTEMVENVLRHSASESPAFLCGQLSAQKKKLELCLVDAGQSIQASLAKGSNSEAVERLKGGEPALKLATELALSSSGASSNGLGLFLATQAVRLNKGAFRLTSGKETLFLSKEGLRHRSHAEWRGTVVNFLFNLANTGPLADVYKTLGTAVAPGEPFFEPGVDRAQGAAVALKGEGPYVGSRRAAAAARQQMAGHIESGTRAVADGDGIAAMTPGFADECFGELLGSLGEARFRELVFLKNANESTRLLCEMVVGRRVRPADPNAPPPPEPEKEPEPEPERQPEPDSEPDETAPVASAKAQGADAAPAPSDDEEFEDFDDDDEDDEPGA